MTSAAKIVVRMDKLSISGGSSSSSTTSSSSRSSPRWSSWPPMPTAREGSSAVAVGSDIYLMGGYHSSIKFLSQCSKLNTDTHEWTELPPMRQARMGCAAVYSKEKQQVIVVGGFSKGRTYLNTVETLDLNTLEWSNLAPMAEARAGCAAVVVPQGVVVLGGWKDSETSVNTVELYDFNTKAWTKLPPMYMGRAGSAAVAITDYGSSVKVMVLGGHCTAPKYRGSRSSVEVLDLTSKKWTKWPSMREKRDSAAACVVGQCIFVMGGGETSVSPLASVEVFSLETRQWKRITSMKSKRFGCAATAISNRIVVLGGRGVDGKHLDTVESIEIPLLDGMEEELVLPLSDFLLADNNARVNVVLDTNQAVDTMVATVTKMMEADKDRARTACERTKRRAKELYERVAKETEERLQALELERKRIQDQKEAAKRQKEEQYLHAEKERREAMKQIEASFRPLLEQAQNSATDLLGPMSWHGSLGSLRPESTVSGSKSDIVLPSPPVEDVDPPSELCCCITGCLMEDPVTAMDGHTYERDAIEKWFQGFPQAEPPTSPMTNERLPSRRLIPSYNIRSQCKTWLAKLGKDSVHAPTSQGRGTSLPQSTSHTEGRRWSRVGGDTSSRRSVSSRIRLPHPAVNRSASMAMGMPIAPPVRGRANTTTDFMDRGFYSAGSRARRQSIA